MADRVGGVASQRAKVHVGLGTECEDAGVTGSGKLGFGNVYGILGGVHGPAKVQRAARRRMILTIEWGGLVTLNLYHGVEVDVSARGEG